MRPFFVFGHRENPQRTSADIGKSERDTFAMSAIPAFQGGLFDEPLKQDGASSIAYPLPADTSSLVMETGGSSYNPASFFRAIERSFANYREFGARSTRKLEPLHGYAASVLKNLWGHGFQVHSIGTGLGEQTVSGRYYPKDIDITITCENRPVFCLGIKFVTSNYKQNANNYFEGMMGETANIQAVGNLPYAHLIILRHQTPYYSKNIFGTPSKIETIIDKDIQKYVNLMRDTRQAHRPDCLGIQLIDIDENSGRVSQTDLARNFPPPIARLLSGQLSIRKLFEDILACKDAFNSDKSWEA
jgi:hypothetical protein